MLVSKISCDHLAFFCVVALKFWFCSKNGCLGIFASSNAPKNVSTADEAEESCPLASCAVLPPFLFLLTLLLPFAAPQWRFLTGWKAAGFHPTAFLSLVILFLSEIGVDHSQGDGIVFILCRSAPWTHNYRHLAAKHDATHLGLSRIYQAFSQNIADHNAWYQQ